MQIYIFFMSTLQVGQNNIEKSCMILADFQVPPQMKALNQTKINKKQGGNFTSSLAGSNFLLFYSAKMAG